MTFSEILEEIKKVEPVALENVEDGVVATLAARRGRKNRAIESMHFLKKAYAEELRRNSAFIIVIGDKREEFVALASKGKKSLTTNPELFFTELADRVSPQLYMGKESVSNLFDVLGRHLEDKMVSLDVVGYSQLIFKQEYQRTFTSREDFLSLVRQAVVNTVGGEIVGIYASRLLTDTAISKGYSKVVPIFLPTSDERFGLKVARDLSTINKRTFVVVAGETKFSLEGLQAITLGNEELDSAKTKKAMDSISKKL